MIYFVACEAANAVKIGFTNNPPYHRLMSMQAGCPFDLELVGVDEGNCHDERMLHHRFKDHRLRGEWFTLTDELRAHIETLSVPVRHPRGWRSPKAAA